MSESPRVALIEPGTRPELADVERAILAERGRISSLYRALLNSAPIASGWEKMLTAVRNRASIRADLRELMILRVAVLNRAVFEFDAHVPQAKKAGITQEKIDALRTWPQGQGVFTQDERLVLELTNAMTRDVEVEQALMQHVKERFDDRAVVELVATVAAYNMVSRFLVALHIEH